MSYTYQQLKDGAVDMLIASFAIGIVQYLMSAKKMVSPSMLMAANFVNDKLNIHKTKRGAIATTLRDNAWDNLKTVYFWRSVAKIKWTWSTSGKRLIDANLYEAKHEYADYPNMMEELYYRNFDRLSKIKGLDKNINFIFMNVPKEDANPAYARKAMDEYLDVLSKHIYKYIKGQNDGRSIGILPNNTKSIAA